jgi:TonB family protein
LKDSGLLQRARRDLWRQVRVCGRGGAALLAWLGLAGFVGLPGAASGADGHPRSSVASIAPLAAAAAVPSPALEPAAATPDAAPQRSVADEVGSMLVAMDRAEAAVRGMLQRLDAFIAQGRAQFTDVAGGAGRDWRWSLLERVDARIRSLLDPEALVKQRDAARAQLEKGDAAGARRTIVEFMQPFMQRAEEAEALVNYIPRRIVSDLATTRLRALLRANGVLSPQLPRIEQLEALIAARESREDFLMAADIELGELEALQKKAYDEAFTTALNAAREKQPGTLKLEPRTERCPVVSDLGPVTDAPRVNTTLSTPTSAYYPQEALARGIGGKVAVQARVTPGGCVRAAGVLVSTGVEALDAAALRWMLEGAVFSRSKPRPDGEEASTMLNVNFKAAD